MTRTDILVVGQGLAGSLLALELERLGARVLIVDDSHRDSASMAAAGLLNPVTGARFSATENAGTLVPFSASAFRDLEQRLGSRFFQEIPVFRAYENPEEIRLKSKRSADPGNARWFGEEVSRADSPATLNAPLGGVFLIGGGRVDIPAFLSAARGRFGKGNRSTPGEAELVEAPFVHDELELLPGEVGARYRDTTARHVVFAEGAAVSGNPWFRDLAWQPAKGEFIICKTSAKNLPRFALKIGLSAVPVAEDTWMVGSNYEWNPKDCSPTPHLRDAFMEGFEKMFLEATGAKITEHRAGVRPAARGAKPIVGAHQDFPCLHVFNGFGAKGCTKAPFFARNYAEQLFGRAIGMR